MESSLPRDLTEQAVDGGETGLSTATGKLEVCIDRAPNDLGDRSACRSRELLQLFVLRGPHEEAGPDLGSRVTHRAIRSR